MSVSIKSDGVLERVAQNLGRLPDWLPAIVRVHMDTLGAIVVDEMKAAVEEHRYTGALSDSITHQAADGGYEQRIYPTAMRGAYDAGTILELGTRPIPNARWAPIRAWADFRGLPAFPVWWKIRTLGVSEHPFLERTLQASGEHITEAARRMVTTAAEQILYGGGKVGV